MSYFIIPQSGEEWGFHKEKTEKQGMGNGRRTRAEQRRGKGAVIKDKRRISSKECIDAQFTFIPAGGRWILRRLYHSHHFLNKYTYPAAPKQIYRIVTKYIIKMCMQTRINKYKYETA